jgi:8-oxo-dGTP pyrophosphatase MutT (NUDIX family)
MSMRDASDAALSSDGVITIDAIDLRLDPHPWAFAERHRAEIDAHFARRRAKTPALWNGRVLLMRRHTIAGGVLTGSFLEVDYAAFLAWQDWGHPAEGVVNTFALGALRSADGALLMGIMGPQTANAGSIYFPGGTPDPSDVTADGRVDLAANVMRELAEETGLTADDLVPQSGWTLCVSDARLALIKELRSDLAERELRQRVERHLAAEAAPELAGIYVARSPADIHPRMPEFMQRFLRHYWSAPKRHDDEGVN